MSRIVLAVLLFLSWPIHASTPAINWYTEEYPPFNYLHEGALEGISIRVLRAVYQKLDWQLKETDILLMPWARTYKTLEESDNACVFSITYTKERANQFQFIGPMIENTVSLIGSRESDYQEVDIKNIASIKIGVVKNDIGHQILLKEGFSEHQFVFLKTGFELVRMLKMRRVDLIAYGDVIARFQFLKANINFRDYKIIQPLLQSYLGMACNSKVEKHLIDAMNNALKAVLAENPELVHLD